MQDLWPGDFFRNRVISKSRGVAILIKYTFEYKIIVPVDKSGNLLTLDMTIGDNKIVLLNIY